MIQHWKNMEIKDDNLIKAIVEFVSGFNESIRDQIGFLENKIKKE